MTDADIWTSRTGFHAGDEILPPPYDAELSRWHLLERLIAAVVIVGMSIGGIALWSLSHV